MSVSQEFFDASTPSGLTVPAIVQASSATSAAVAIPAEWYGRFVDFTFEGNAARDKICIRFGVTAAAAAVALHTASTNAGAATYAITPVDSEPMIVLFDGGTARRRLDSRWRFFCHISNTALGYLHAAITSGAAGPG